MKHSCRLSTHASIFVSYYFCVASCFTKDIAPPWLLAGHLEIARSLGLAASDEIADAIPCDIEKKIFDVFVAISTKWSKITLKPVLVIQFFRICFGPNNLLTSLNNFFQPKNRAKLAELFVCRPGTLVPGSPPPDPCRSPSESPNQPPKLQPHPVSG